MVKNLWTIQLYNYLQFHLNLPMKSNYKNNIIFKINKHFFNSTTIVWIWINNNQMPLGKKSCDYEYGPKNVKVYYSSENFQVE